MLVEVAVGTALLCGFAWWRRDKRPPVSEDTVKAVLRAVGMAVPQHIVVEMRKMKCDAGVRRVMLGWVARELELARRQKNTAYANMLYLAARRVVEAGK